MKTAVSSLDVACLARELSEKLSGAFCRKAYQVGEKEVVLNFRKPGEGGLDLVVAPNFLCLTSYRRKAPANPTGFAMQLRKEVGGSKVAAVRQQAFDRIIEIDFDAKNGTRTLVCELFSRGNMLLLNQKRGIIGLLEWQKWRDRKLGVGQDYEFPPSKANPRELDAGRVADILSASDKDLVRTLAVDAGLGGKLAEEVCARAGVDKNMQVKTAVESYNEKIHSEIEKIHYITEKEDFSPRIVLEDGMRVDVTPFGFRVYENREIIEYPTFNEAVDEYFAALEKQGAKKAGEKKVSDVLGKLRAIEKKQVETLKKANENTGEYKRAGDAIYANMAEIQGIINAVKKGREKGLTDKEITAELAKASALVKEVKGTKLVLDL